MILSRWIALFVLCVSLAYAYTAFFIMDAALQPFMRLNPIWPSTFPKILGVLAIVVSSLIVLGVEKESDDFSFATFRLYHIGPALMLLALMVAYALLLRPAGFVFATFGFLVCGSVLLGERKFHFLIPIAATATGVVWYLVDYVLGIYLSPFPLMFM